MKKGEIHGVWTQLLSAIKRSSDLWSDSAVNLESLLEHGTVEIRALRPQQNAREFKVLAQLFQERIRYLDPFTGFIEPNFRDGALSLSDEEKILRFFDYVTETGLDYLPYESLLRGSYQWISQRIIPRRKDAREELVHARRTAKSTTQCPAYGA